MLGYKGPLVRANVITVVAPATRDHQMLSKGEIKGRPDAVARDQAEVATDFVRDGDSWWRWTVRCVIPRDDDVLGPRGRACAASANDGVCFHAKRRAPCRSSDDPSARGILCVGQHGEGHSRIGPSMSTLP